MPETGRAAGGGHPADDETIIFMHVPKAAGATLRRQLHAIYGVDQVMWFQPGRLDAWMERLKAMPLSERQRLRVVTGHFRYGKVDELLPGRLAYVTVLRDPVERIRSFYQFVRATPQNPLHEVANGCSLADFCRRQDVPGLDDQQTRMLSDNTGGRRPLTEACYDLALRNLDSFAVAGVQEHYDDFLRALAKRFRWQDIPFVGSANTSRERIVVDAEARAVIEARNRFDCALHRHLLGRWRQAGDAA